MSKFWYLYSALCGRFHIFLRLFNSFVEVKYCWDPWPGESWVYRALEQIKETSAWEGSIQSFGRWRIWTDFSSPAVLYTISCLLFLLWIVLFSYVSKWLVYQTYDATFYIIYQTVRSYYVILVKWELCSMIGFNLLWMRNVNVKIHHYGVCLFAS